MNSRVRKRLKNKEKGIFESEKLVTRRRDHSRRACGGRERREDKHCLSELNKVRLLQ